MNEEKLMHRFKDILKGLLPGCDNMVELKSKCSYCMYNAGPYKDKKIMCAKKLYEKL